MHVRTGEVERPRAGSSGCGLVNRWGWAQRSRVLRFCRAGPRQSPFQFTSALVGILVLILGTTSALAARPKSGSDGDDFFESKVRPVMAEHCFKCHSPQPKSPKGGLRLDTFDGMRRGADTGAPVAPDRLAAIPLVKAPQD